MLCCDDDIVSPATKCKSVYGEGMQMSNIDLEYWFERYTVERFEAVVGWNLELQQLPL